MDPPRPQRAAVDEPGVRLYQRGASTDAVPRIVGGLDPADGHQDDLVSDSATQPAEHLHRPLLEGGAGQPARPDGLDLDPGADQAVAGDGGVGSDDPIESPFD